MRILVCLCGALIFSISCSFGQVDSLLNKTAQFPNRIFAKINAKTSSLNEALTKQTERYLNRLVKKEKKIQEKLYETDSNAARNLFNGSETKYTSLQSQVASGGSAGSASLTGEYLPYNDSIKTSFILV
jgi:hypothetical protein